jgi:peptidyl-prolyl cis-trans isomerase C
MKTWGFNKLKAKQKGDKRMKFFKDTIQMIMLITFFTLPLSVFSLALGQKGVDKPIAMVNGTAITQNDLDKELNRIRMQAADRQQPIDDAEIPTIKEKIRESLINRELLYQSSLAAGITVSALEVENQLEQIKQQLNPGKSFAEALTEINISQAEFEREISKAIAIQKFLDAEIYQKVSVFEKETKIFYDNNPQLFKKPEQVKASHILIHVDSQATLEQKQQARNRSEEIKEKLSQGEDFAVLAKHFSDCPSSKNGGDLGFFDRNKMVKPFADAAFSLKPGEISGIVETQFGYHLIKVFEKTPESVMPYADVKERLNRTLTQQKIQKETLAHIQKLKEAADIQRISQ